MDNNRMSDMINKPAFDGQDVKYLVQIDTPGFNIETDDFNIIVRGGGKEKTFQKADLVDDVTIVDGAEVRSYYLCFNTGFFGPCGLEAIVTAYARDTDFPGGIRIERDKFHLQVVEQL